MHIVDNSPRARRITYVIGSMGIGGAELHLLALAIEMSSKGWQCEVFALNPAGPLRQRFESEGLKVFGWSAPRMLAGLALSDRVSSRFGLVLSVPLLWLHLRRHRPDIVHFFLPAAYVLGGLVSLWSPTPRRLMSRRSLNRYQDNHSLFKVLERFLHRRMDLILANSHAVFTELLSEGVRPQQLRLIYNGVTAEDFVGTANRELVLSSLGLTTDTLVFITVANLIPYKGHLDLIEAFGRIDTLLPESWTLLCVGRDDGIGDSLRKYAESFSLQAKVRFLGQRQDVAELLSAADIGVLCSHEEGFSNAILEGMAAGLPMVVTDVGGNAEAVLHGNTGLVVSPRNVEEIAAALLSMARMPDRKRMGDAGRLRVQDMFSSSRCFEAYDAVYTACVTCP